MKEDTFVMVYYGVRIYHKEKCGQGGVESNPGKREESRDKYLGDHPKFLFSKTLS